MGPLPTQRFRAVLWRWPIVLLVTLLVVIGGSSYALQTPDERSAQAVLSLVPQEGVDTAADLIQLSVSRYAVKLTSLPTMEKVAAETGLSIEQVSGAVSVSSATETANLTVLVRDTSADDALAIAEAVVTVGLALGRGDTNVDVEVPAPAAVLSASTLTPDREVMLLSLLLGLALGVAAALLAERLRPRLGGLAHVERATGVRVTGFVPSSPGLLRLGRERVTPDVAHAVGLLRTVLTAPSQQNPCQVVAVVAPGRGTGATTVASLLTGSLASGGSRVCLLDADLAAPSLASTFDLDPQPGLVDLLEGKSTLDEVLRKFVPEGATVIPTSIGDMPGDRLARGLRSSLADVRRERDFVLVDCAPVLGEDDAAGVVVTHADCVLLVVDPRSSMRSLRETVSVLRYLKAPLVGMVVNRCDGRGAWARTADFDADASRDRTGS